MTESDFDRLYRLREESEHFHRVNSVKYPISSEALRDRGDYVEADRQDEIFRLERLRREQLRDEDQPHDTMWEG